MVAGRGVTSVVKRSADTSDIVTFDRSVANCAWTATINSNGFWGPTPGWGHIQVESDGGPDNPAGTTPRKLRVRIFDNNNIPVVSGAGASFSMIVQC